MKIAAPINSSNEVKPVIEAGANELYCGFLPKKWRERYTHIASINRRQLDKAQFQSWDELKKAVKIAHSFEVPIFLTLNEHYYTKKQYPLIFNFIEKAVDIGIGAIMVSDVALLSSLEKSGDNFEIHMSIGGTTFNLETANFYKERGVKRIILPRHLTLEEIEKIKKRVDMDVEAFIFNERCINVDGFCTFQHALEFINENMESKNACSLDYDISIFSKNKKLDHELVKNVIEHLYVFKKGGIIDCGVCALYEFIKLGVDSVKIVGRQKQTHKKARDVAFVRRLIDFIEIEKLPKDKFEEKAQKEFISTYRQMCSMCRCYYPEVLDDGEI